MIGVILFSLTLLFTYQFWIEKGGLCAGFYLGSLMIIWWVIWTERLPWYCILILIIGRGAVLYGFDKKESDKADK